ncbi:MAG: 4'-phosphopantetheinyl transferase superfamily protein [Nocardioides sp.]
MTPGETRILDTWVASERELLAWADRHPVLDVVERRRAESSGARGAHATASAVLLRLLAGARVGVPPAEVEVRRTCASCGGADHGRPVAAGLAASLSHSGDVVVAAIGDVSWLGIDVERVRPIDVRRLAGVALHPREREVVADDVEAFIDTWSIKEAVLKASGTGIVGGGLRRQVVDSLRPLRVVDLSDLGCASGVVHRLPVPEGYTGFVAVEGSVTWRHVSGLADAAQSSASRIV